MIKIDESPIPWCFQSRLSDMSIEAKTIRHGHHEILSLGRGKGFEHRVDPQIAVERGLL